MWVEANCCRVFIRLNLSIARSRRRKEWCEFSTRLFALCPLSWRPLVFRSPDASCTSACGGILPVLRHREEHNVGEHRVALATGAASGIGLAIATQFAENAYMPRGMLSWIASGGESNQRKGLSGLGLRAIDLSQPRALALL